MSLNRSSPSFRLGLFVTLLFIVSQACGLPFITAPAPAEPDADREAMQSTLTAVQAQLQEALGTLSALAIAASLTPQALPETPTPTMTSTPTSIPTNTPTPTLTSTPTFTLPPPTAPVYIPPTILVVTATPIAGGQPKIHALVNSNCREGPSRHYKRLGYLLVGETSEVYGRDSAWTWWYIREPRRHGIMCWVWGGSTQVEGDTSHTPMLTPKPEPVSKTKTPTGASFSIVEITKIKCGGEPTVMVKVKNNGGKALESARLKIIDQTQGKVVFGPQSSNNPFRSSSSDCSSGGDRLNPGKTLWIGATLTGENISNHKIKVEITMCSEEGLSGKCSSSSATKKMP